MLPYVPARAQYRAWYTSTIHRPLGRCAGRSHLSGWLRVIRRQDGSAEAKRFRDWLHWLGTYPVQIRRIPRLQPTACPGCGFIGNCGGAQ